MITQCILKRPFGMVIVKPTPVKCLEHGVHVLRPPFIYRIS